LHARIAKTETRKQGFRLALTRVCGFEKLAGYLGIWGPINLGLHSLIFTFYWCGPRNTFYLGHIKPLYDDDAEM